MKRLISALFIILFIQLPVIANEATKEVAQAMIVFDASGSMWGQIEGETKIKIAKTALNKVVSDWDENVHLGLIAYGHRKKGDCDDIQTLVPIAKIDKKNMISKVKEIKPKGKTPISRSLKKAAEDLRYTEEKATIILISDGKETCNADPCATAKSLEGEGIDFVAHVIGFDVDKQTDKQLKCIADATGGEYFSAKNASSLNEAMATIVKKVEVKEVAPKPPAVKKLKDNLEITTVEKEGGKWVKARHHIYEAVDGKIDGSYIKWCDSLKKKACVMTLPVGSYILQTEYTFYKKNTALEISSGELKKANIIIGQTGELEITTVEKEDGKWVKARHHIYKAVDGKIDGSYIKWCDSQKKKACIMSLPVGSYIVKTEYNHYKKHTALEISSGELNKASIIIGQTGELEITTVEKEGGKWVKARHHIYKAVDGKIDGSYIKWCDSQKKKACVMSLPVGSYILKTEYNHYKKNTALEISSAELNKASIIIGQTGELEITTVEKEDGKWVKARHHIYKAVNGKIDGSYIKWCDSQKKKACVINLPVGSYTIKTEYNHFKKNTALEISSGELNKASIIIGQTGELEIITVEEEGGKWVKARHHIYKAVDGKIEDSYIKWCDSLKKKACVISLPVGDYILKTDYKKFKKETAFKASSESTTKLNIVFSQFVLGAKCVEMSSPVSYEIYASTGRMVFEKKAKCSDRLQISIDNGDYSIETRINNETKETKFSVGAGHPNSITIDMQAINKESSREELIKADTQEKAKPEAPQAKPSAEEETAPEQPEEKPLENTPDSTNTFEMNEMASALAQAGAIFGGLQKLQNQPLQTFKGDILSVLPIIKKAKTCYQEASHLNQVGACETMEEEVAQKSPVKIMPTLEKHSEWDEELKQASIDRAERYIMQMELNITCVDKGADLSQMEGCVKNDGKFTAKKSELEQMGDLFKALGNMKK